MNLVKVYCRHGALMVEAAQLAKINSSNRCLTIYTTHGNLLQETAKTEYERSRASYGIHPANIFASAELADADSKRIRATMERR